LRRNKIAAYQELTIEQGATFTSNLTVDDSSGDPVNLTNWNPYAVLRKTYDSTTSNNFTVTVTSAPLGEISMTMPSANTASLAAGRYCYDLVIANTVVNSDSTYTKTRVLEGIVNVTPAVTTSTGAG